MKDEIQIAQEVPRSLNALVDRAPQAMSAELGKGKQFFVQVLLRPGPFLKKAMLMYGVYFGRRRLASRSMKPQNVQDKIKQLVRSRAPVIKPMTFKAKAKTTKNQRTGQWIKSVSTLVSIMRKAKAAEPATSLEPLRTMQTIVCKYNTGQH